MRRQTGDSAAFLAHYEAISRTHLPACTCGACMVIRAAAVSEQ